MEFIWALRRNGEPDDSQKKRLNCRGEIELINMSAALARETNRNR